MINAVSDSNSMYSNFSKETTRINTKHSKFIEQRSKISSPLPVFSPKIKFPPRISFPVCVFLDVGLKIKALKIKIFNFELESTNQN